MRPNLLPHLVRDATRRWLTGAGLLVVLLIALVPPALTAAWVYTHQADVALTALTWDVQEIDHGETVNVTATVRNLDDAPVGAFNVTLRVGYYEQALGGAIRWRDAGNLSERVGPLDAGAEATVTLAWTATGGTFQVEAYADDFANEIKEIEEQNNYRVAQIQARHAPARISVAPSPPSNETAADADLALDALRWSPSALYERENVTFEVAVLNRGPDAVENATVSWRVCRLSAFGDCSVDLVTGSANVSLAAGASEVKTFEWRNAPIGAFATILILQPPERVHDASLDDNIRVQQLDVERRLLWEEPEERATAKDFYRNRILLPLHFSFLVPLVAIFYAGSVLEEERARGNLPYLLTRPVARWLIPVTRFAVGFAVALVPVLAAVVLTYALLFALTPQGIAGYLYWPLLFGGLVVFVYAAVATFLGVVSRRPYLVGLAYVVGFETLILAGRRILFNGQPLVQDWVLNLSLATWLERAYTAWDPKAFSWLPAGDEGVRATLVLLGIALASLAGAAWWMRNAEVD